MPTIPSLAPSVGHQGLTHKSYYSAPEVRNGAIAPLSKVSQASGAFSALAEKLQDEADEASAKALDNRLSSAIRNILSAPGDEKGQGAGYLLSQGKDALDRRDATIEAIRRAAQDVEKAASGNPRLAQAMKGISTARIDQAMGQLNSHAGRQIGVFRQRETEARIENTREDAMVNAQDWANPTGPFAVAKGVMTRESNQLADQFGLSEAGRKQLVQGNLTKLHAGVIDQFIAAEKPGAAKDYLSAHWNEIDPDQRDNLQKFVQTGTVKAESLALSFALTGSTHQKLAELKRSFSAGKITAEMYDATRGRVLQQESEARIGRAESRHWLLGQVQDFRDKNPTKSYKDLPTAIQAALKNQGMIDLAKATIERGTIDDGNEWLSFMSMSMSNSLAEMDEATLAEITSAMSAKHREQAIALWSKARGKNADPEKVTEAKISREIFTTARRTGIAKNKYDPKIEAFEQAANDAIDDLRKSGKPIRMDEVKRIIDGLVVKGEVKGNWFWNPNKRFYEAKAAGEEFINPEFSVEDRKRMAERLKRQNLPSTPADITEALLEAYGIAGEKK